MRAVTTTSLAREVFACGVTVASVDLLQHHQNQHHQHYQDDQDKEDQELHYILRYYFHSYEIEGFNLRLLLFQVFVHSS